MPLFSMPTPEQVRQSARQNVQNQARLFAQAPPGRGFVQTASQAGGLFGEAIGRSMGGKAPGEEDAMKFQQVQNEVMRQVNEAGIDVSSPQGFLQMTNLTAQLASEVGLPQVAQQAALQGLEVRKQFQSQPKESSQRQKMEELIAQGVDPVTAEGIAYGTYKQAVDPTTGDVIITDLRKVGKPEESAEQVRKGTRQIEKFEEDVTDFAKGIEKSGIVQQEAALSEVEDIFKRFEKGDIPGVGLTASLPDFLISEDGKEVRQRLQTLFNMTLKDRSGAAVTSPELDRLKKEFGSGLFKTDDQLRSALARFRRALEQHKATLAAGAKDAVVKEFQGRGGIFLKKIGKTRLRWNPDTQSMEPADG